MGQITTDQSHAVMAILATNADWDKIDFDFARLQDNIIRDPKGAGERFTTFLRNGCRLVIGEPKSIMAKPFDLVKFLGKGWSIWKGPADGDGLSGDEDVCPKVEVELSKFVFRHCLKEGETSITGAEKIRRLNEMSDFIGFGPNVFLGLWEDYQANKENSALEWLFQNFGVTFMDFPGAILRNPDGNRSVLYLYRDSDGGWHWRCNWLDSQWDAGYPSAGCAS